MLTEDYAYKVIKVRIKMQLLVFDHDWNHNITVSIYKNSHDHSHRDSNSPSPRPLHVIIKVKQYQQSYNSTPGPTTVDTHIKNQKNKEDHHIEVVEPDHVTSNHDTTFQPLPRFTCSL